MEGLELNRLTSYLKEHPWNQIIRAKAGYNVRSGLVCDGGNGYYVYVNAGVAWIDNQSYTLSTGVYQAFEGLVDPAKDRYDLLCIDTSGLSVIKGTEATSPTPPLIPETKVVLACVSINNDDISGSGGNLPDIKLEDVLDWRVFGNVVSPEKWLPNVGGKYVLYQQEQIFYGTSAYTTIGQITHLFFVKHQEPLHAFPPETERICELVGELKSSSASNVAVHNYFGSFLISAYGHSASSYTLLRRTIDTIPTHNQSMSFAFGGTNPTTYIRGLWMNYYAKVK